METFEAEFSDMYACYDCKKILKKGDEYKFKILCTDCFEMEEEDMKFNNATCKECGEGFIRHDFSIYCPTCTKELWIKNRSERLEKELYTAHKVTAPNNIGRDEFTEGQVMFEKVIHELFDLYSRKNKDYGNAFGNTYQEFGIVSSVIRLNDKMNRLKKLTATGSQEVKDESIRDTLVDLANYAIMTLVEIDKNGQK